MPLFLTLTEVNIWKGSAKPRPGAAPLVRRDLPSPLSSWRVRFEVCSLQSCAKPFVSRSHLHAHSPSLSSPCVTIQKPLYGVGFYSNHRSTHLSIGSSPSLQGHSTGALSQCIPLHPTSIHSVAERTWMFLPHFDVICIQSLNRRTAT